MHEQTHEVNIQAPSLAALQVPEGLKLKPQAPKQVEFHDEPLKSSRSGDLVKQQKQQQQLPPDPSNVKEVTQYLKPLQEEFMEYLETNFYNNEDYNENNENDDNDEGFKKISQYSLCVNDSALGKNFEEVYELGNLLGEGGFAVVYSATHKGNHNKYAVKVVNEEEAEVAGENVEFEIQTLKLLSASPYVTRLIDVFHETGITYLVMEQMTGGDLLDKINDKGKFTEYEARKLARRLFEAVDSCHKKYIVHRDIKPDNIMIVRDDNDDTNIKLTDFGCAKRFNPLPNDDEDDYFDEYALRTMCGSPAYVAPEVYMHENGYDERCDLWSIGVVIYVLLCGYCPFEGDEYELPNLICEGYYQFDDEEWFHISDEAKHVIKMMLQVDTSKRGTIQDALTSDWLRRHDTRVGVGDLGTRRSSIVLGEDDNCHKKNIKSKISPPFAASRMLDESSTSCMMDESFSNFGGDYKSYMDESMKGFNSKIPAQDIAYDDRFSGSTDELILEEEEEDEEEYEEEFEEEFEEGDRDEDEDNREVESQHQQQPNSIILEAEDQGEACEEEEEEEEEEECIIKAVEKTAASTDSNNGEVERMGKETVINEEGNTDTKEANEVADEDSNESYLQAFSDCIPSSSILLPTILISGCVFYYVLKNVQRRK